ncbi:hypothetical protein PGAAJM_11460 [Kocuria varians]
MRVTLSGTANAAIMAAKPARCSSIVLGYSPAGVRVSMWRMICFCSALIASP